MDVIPAEKDLFGDQVFTGERRENDYYPTPVQCVDPLIELIDWSKVELFLEPCRGHARSIYDRVPIPDERKYWAELSEGVDYKTTEFEPVDLIITNPPFSIALDFLQKSLTEAPCVCYLLRLSFLGSQERAMFWRENRPTHLFVLSKRPSFTGDGTDNSEYMWVCWDYEGLLHVEPGVHWI